MLGAAASGMFVWDATLPTLTTNEAQPTLDNYLTTITCTTDAECYTHFSATTDAAKKIVCC